MSEQQSEATTVVARMPPGGEAGPFEDITDAPLVDSYFNNDGSVAVVFGGVLTSAQIAAVRRRIISTSAAEEALRAEVEAMIDGVTDPAAAVTTIARLVTTMGQPA